MSLEGARALVHRLRQVVTQPRGELTRWQAALRTAYDLGRYGARRLKGDRAPQMAAALSFRTLFALLPVLVVGTLLVRAIGGFAQFRDVAAETFSALGMDGVRITGTTATGADEGADQALSAWLLGLVTQVEEINLAAITWIGVIILVYSALSLMVTIEASFNDICRAPQGRAWGLRLPIYWTVLTLGPAAMAASVYLTHRLEEILEARGLWWALLQAAAVAWAFMVTWALMFCLYKWVPNTTVGFRPAIAGAFVAALLLEAGKASLGAYLQHALSLRQLYGSLGLVPLFMFWVYLMWLTVLFGLEVSAGIAWLGDRPPDEFEEQPPPTALVEPAAVLAVVSVIARRFEDGRPTRLDDAAAATGLSPRTVARMLERLVEAGVVHRLQGDPAVVSLARPPEQVALEPLMDIGFELADAGALGRTMPLVEKLRDAQRQVTAQLTLRSLAAESASER